MQYLFTTVWEWATIPLDHVISFSAVLTVFFIFSLGKTLKLNTGIWTWFVIWSRSLVGTEFFLCHLESKHPDAKPWSSAKLVRVVNPIHCVLSSVSSQCLHECPGWHRPFSSQPCWFMAASSRTALHHGQ